MWNETGSVRRDPGGRLGIALVYPNTYWIGMSNLGLQQMYRLFNAHQGIFCERFFTDSPRSVESGRSLSDFPIIAFSISYELDFIEAVRILKAHGVPVRTRERGGRPIVMAGGAALTANPEPVAEAFDICFLGDGETFPARLHDAYAASSSYGELLERLSIVQGVYAPSLTRPEHEGEDIAGYAGPAPRLSVKDPLDDPARTAVLTRDTAFGDMYLVEIARGCPFTCRFCSAREIYAPYRAVAAERLEAVFTEAARHRDKVGLVSTSLNNHPGAPELFRMLREKGLKVAPPSLRPGMISPELIEALTNSGVKGVTLAPETGSQELRHAMGKRIANDVILADVGALVASGIRDVKLYFMVGLPGEDLGHIEESIDLIRRIRQTFIHVSRGNRKIGTVSVSVNVFVPKAHTPFERCAMLEPKEARDRIRRIERGLKKESNVTVAFEGPKWAYLQAIIARGDRRVLSLILELAASDASSWQRVLRSWQLNPDYYALRPRGDTEILPWSFYSTACPQEDAHALQE